MRERDESGGTPREKARWCEGRKERVRERERERDRGIVRATRRRREWKRDERRTSGGTRRVAGQREEGGRRREDTTGAKEVRSEERARGRTRERDAGVGTHLPIHMYVSTRDLLRYRLSSLSLSCPLALSLFLPSLPSFVPGSLFPSISASLFTSSNSVAPSLFPL